MSLSGIRVAAAVLGATGVAAAAFGAHGLERIATGEVHWWAIASAIQLVSAPSVLALAGAPQPTTDGVRAVPLSKVATVSAWLLFAGTAVFSGSLYLMTLGAPRWFGAITPLGGLMMVMGWSLSALRRD